jgi:carbohydrate-selective porin OprB
MRLKERRLVCQAQYQGWLLLLAFCAFFSCRAAAQDVLPASLTESTTRQDDSSHSTTPQSVLQGLSHHGVTFQETLIYDWSKSASANTDSTAGYGRYLFEFAAPVDGEKLYHLKGSSGMLRLRNHVNAFGQNYVAVAQVVSNIDSCSRTTLYEAWLQQQLFSGKVRLKAGKIDANTEFAAVSTAADFLNSSMGYSPTILEFPTYPEPKSGLNVFLRPTAATSLGLGVYQTAAGNRLLILEPSHAWSVGPLELPGRASFGYWRIGGEAIERFDGARSSSTQGFYSVTEQVLWKATGSDDSRKLSSFLQLGSARGDESAFTRHLGAGLVLQAPQRMHRDNSIGIAATWVRLSSHQSVTPPLRDEVVFESYYKVALQKHVVFVSDFQYVHNPAGLVRQQDLPVITPRMIISF